MAKDSNEMFPTLKDWSVYSDEFIRELIAEASNGTCFECSSNVEQEAAYAMRNPVDLRHVVVGHKHEIEYVAMLSSEPCGAAVKVQEILEAELSRRTKVRAEIHQDRAEFNARNAMLVAKLMKKAVEKVTKDDVEKVFADRTKLELAWKTFRADRQKGRGQTAETETTAAASTKPAQTQSLGNTPRIVQSSKPKQKLQAKAAGGNGKATDVVIHDVPQPTDVRLSASARS